VDHVTTLAARRRPQTANGHLRLAVAFAALLLLGLVGITAGQVASQGDTQIVLAAKPVQGRVASLTALKATRAILMERLAAVRSLFTQAPNVQIVTTGERQHLVVDVHLASAISPRQVVMNLLGQVPQMVRDRQWSFHLPADNERRARLHEVMGLLRQGQFSILAYGSTVLAPGRSTAPVLVSSQDITPGSIRVVPHMVGPVGPPAIVFTLQKAAAARLVRYMRRSPGKMPKMPVALDNTIIVPPAIAIEPPAIARSIPPGALELLCSGGERQMQALVILLKYGPTPTELKIVSMQ
jgi:hypothetical protein